MVFSCRIFWANETWGNIDKSNNSSGLSWINAFLVAQTVKESACNSGDLGLIPGSGRFPWRGKWQPSAVFLTGESHGQRSLEGYSLRGRKESDMTERLTLHFSWIKGQKGIQKHCVSVFLPIRDALIVGWSVSFWRSRDTVLKNHCLMSWADICKRHS